MSIDLEHFRGLLLARKVELEKLIRVARDGARPVELDQTRIGRLSRMDAMQGRAMAEATELRREQEMQRVEAALQRLAEGAYGFCLICDEPIPEKRLEFDPAIATCVACVS